MFIAFLFILIFTPAGSGEGAKESETLLLRAYQRHLWQRSWVGWVRGRMLGSEAFGGLKILELGEAKTSVPIFDIRYVMMCPFACDHDRPGPSSRWRCLHAPLPTNEKNKELVYTIIVLNQ